ncbi:MAG: DUF4254 domain-containing protein [Deltaproteobacteria bacterium]|nr:DUF4254 domain-containing protein [Deltaproteobacteria bacterium]
MADLIDPEQIVKLQTADVERWHAGPIVLDQRDELMLLVEQNHARNFELWHEEDRARDPEADDRVIATVKRAIDKLNQARNDAMEKIDELVLARLDGRGQTTEGSPLHSETVGSIVDRLSILSLKCYHMREQTLRKDASDEHRESCRDKLRVLETQRADLAGALGRFAGELERGEKAFRVYRQMKMYNDPSLNPVLYDKKP